MNQLSVVYLPHLYTILYFMEGFMVQTPCWCNFFLDEFLFKLTLFVEEWSVWSIDLLKIRQLCWSYAEHQRSRILGQPRYAGEFHIREESSAGSKEQFMSVELRNLVLSCRKILYPRDSFNNAETYNKSWEQGWLNNFSLRAAAALWVVQKLSQTKCILLGECSSTGNLVLYISCRRSLESATEKWKQQNVKLNKGVQDQSLDNSVGMDK